MGAAAGGSLSRPSVDRLAVTVAPFELAFAAAITRACERGVTIFEAVIKPGRGGLNVANNAMTRARERRLTIFEAGIKRAHERGETFSRL